MLENDIEVRTPEQVRLKLHLAGIGSRAVAQLIDLLILAIVYILFTVSEVMWQWLDVFGRATSYLVGATAVISFLIFWGYFIALETALSGQTVGKRIMKIRTVARDGRPITFYAATIRNLLRIIDFLPFGYLVGMVVTIIDKQERRLGDLAAGTVVVHDRMPALWQYTGDGLRQALGDSDPLGMNLPEHDEPRAGFVEGAEPGQALSDRVGLGPRSPHPADSIPEMSVGHGVTPSDGLRQVITVSKCPVSIEISGTLPGEWTRFLIDLGPRIKGLSKSKREALLPEVWKNLTTLQQVSLQHPGASVELSQVEIERLLMAVSRQLRGPRRGRKLR